MERKSGRGIVGRQKKKKLNVSVSHLTFKLPKKVIKDTKQSEEGS